MKAVKNCEQDEKLKYHVVGQCVLPKPLVSAHMFGYSFIFKNVNLL